MAEQKYVGVMRKVNNPSILLMLQDMLVVSYSTILWLHSTKLRRNHVYHQRTN